jgi:hypothetical protein
MKCSQHECLVAIFATVLLISGCTSDRQPGTPDLGSRLQSHLTREISDGQVRLEQPPDGARVILADQALFPYGRAELTDKGRYVLAGVVEGFLEPRLLRIEVAASPGVPVNLEVARARSVQTYIQGALLPLFYPSSPRQVAPGGAASQGVSITVAIDQG